MRCFVVLLSLFFSSCAFAQTGGLYVRCLDNETVKPIQATLQVYQDSLIEEKSTNDYGRVHFDVVPYGNVRVLIMVDSFLVAQQSAFIQANQVFQMVIEIDTMSKYNSARSATTFDFGSDGQSIELKNQEGRNSASGSTVVRSTTSRIPGLQSESGLQELECVQVVAYNTPLINKSAGATQVTITSQDIRKLPMRSVNSVAGTVGGVVQNEIGQDLYFRGARSTANAYFVDGVRVTDFYGIPKSTIQNVKIITGGIPANYGDVTGGIVSVETSSYMDIERERAAAQMQSNYGVNHYHHYEPPVIDPALNLDRFAAIYENDFLSPVAHPHSTFGIDVDRASWTYVQRRFNNRAEIARDAVKLEEMINAFNYREVEVPENELLHVEMERVACAWNEESELLTIHLKARDLPKDVERKPHNFVFLVDVSGSMSSSDKIGLVRSGLKSFVETLEEKDRVAIVTYAGHVGIALEPTSVSDKRSILQAINNLESGGSTNGMGGIQSAYRLAEENYDPELNNRIILCTDGDFNVGISNTGDLEKYIAQKRGSGIYLTALGFGMGNYRNDILETLADRGDGNHFYIHSMKEMRKVLVEEIGNLINVARDVKLNVEFNPKLVTEYRLIGYENRMLKPKDFEDDTKDAGEVGYNHSVTAIYEIKRGRSGKEKSHFTTTKVNGGKQELAYVRLRYKSFEDSASVERNYSVQSDAEIYEGELMNLVASFGLLLRDSMFKGEMTQEKIKRMAQKYRAKNEDEKELRKMILSM